MYWYKASRFEVVMAAFFVTIIYGSESGADIGPDADIIRVLGS